MKEINEYQLQRRWAVGTCFTGENCWCSPVMIDDNDIDPLQDEDENYVIPPSNITKELAEHIVKLHNDSLLNNNLTTK